MRKNEKKMLLNSYKVQAILLRELLENNMTIEDYARKIALHCRNDIDMLGLEK